MDKVDFIVNELDKSKIENIKVINVEEKTSLTRYMIIGTGTSDRHIDSVAENIRKVIKEKYNIITKKAEGKATGWVLIDLYDIFVNLFTQESRDEYKLENLWEKEIK